MHYPLTYSDSICSFYYGEGKYSHTLNLAVYGETVRKADAEGILFLPDGEVLSDVLRVHESVRTGQRIASSPAILSFGEIFNNLVLLSLWGLHYPIILLMIVLPGG